MKYDTFDKEELINIISKLESENVYLKKLLFDNGITLNSDHQEFNKLSSEEKIDLYLSYFTGNINYVAEQYTNRTTNKKSYSPMCKNKFKAACDIKSVKCNECKFRDFVRYERKIVLEHIKGNISIGLYPIDENNNVKLIVADFDKENYKESALAYKNIAKFYNIDVAIEISQSGNGAHCWIFFENFVSAKDARKIGFFLLNQCIEEGYINDIDSYDRFIPSQDKTGKTNKFGSLIALPLSGKMAFKNTTIFVNDAFQKYDNQFGYLQTVKKVSLIDFNRLLRYIFIKEKEEEFKNNKITKEDFNENLVLIIDNKIHVYKASVSNKGLNFLRKISSVYNPTYFKNQAKGISTFNTPYLIRLFEEDEIEIKLPIGIYIKLIKFFDSKRIKYKIIDKRIKGKKIDILFKGTLRNNQIETLKYLKEKENSLLIAPPAFGKTIVAINAMTEFKRNTLIIVERVQLIEQWIDKLISFTNLSKEDIGVFYSTRKNLKFMIDVASLKSLDSLEWEENYYKKYGLIIIDEVHHIAALSYLKAISKFNTSKIIGLTATLKRSDGNENIIKKLITENIYEIKDEAPSIKRYLHPIFTNYNRDLKVFSLNSNKIDYNKLVTELYLDNDRNELIVNKIKPLINTKNILILTERIEHGNILFNKLKNIHQIYFINGSMSTLEKRRFNEALKSLKEDEKITIISTGKYIGEGFDLDRLDTLFVAMPIKWEGTLKQYVGRLHRESKNKTRVDVFDFIDIKIRIFENMFNTRLNNYRKQFYLGENEEYEKIIYSRENYYKDVEEKLKKAKETIIFFINYCFVDLVKSLIEKVNENVEILIYSDVERLKDINLFNVKVIFKRSDLNLIIIDEKIIYFGDLNAFIYKKEADESLIRINDRLNAKLLKEDAINYTD